MDDSSNNQDERFSKLFEDPRYKKFAVNKKKVKIEKRFQSMFNDEKFKTKYTVDKYGKRINKTSTEELKRFYELESEDSDEEEEERRQEEVAISNERDDLPKEDNIDPECETSWKTKLKNKDIDYARGEGRLFTDSSSSEEFETDDEAEDEVNHNWGEVDQDAETTEDASKRLAILNMDWDRIRASDIMVMCSSFVPTGGSVLNVKIFPSEFGKARLAEEERCGPQELIKYDNVFQNDEGDDKEDEEQNFVDDEGDVDMENLRRYQLNRLRYFYGVIECDSVETADQIYSQCDGHEYESTANKVDLRFIPDDMDFNEDELKDVCTELPNLDKYEPRKYTTTALQQAKVELTWEEGSADRKEFLSKVSSGKFDEIGDQEMKKYVAFSSEDEEDDNEKSAISKYTALLSEINQKEEAERNEKEEREHTWGIGLPEKQTKQKKDKSKMTDIEKIMEKRLEKKKSRKSKKKEQLMSEDKEDDIPDGIDMNDAYFAEEFANGDFVEPKAKKAKKDKKSKKNSNNCEDTVESKELALLIDDEEEDGRNHFSLSKIQKAENKSSKKSKKSRKNASKDAQDVDNFEINLEDSRFKALYTSQLFNIDPSDPKYKKTKAMEMIIDKKIQRNINE